LFSKIRKPLAICATLVAAWFLFFEYDWIGYPRYEWGDEICYSPNHEYYIVRLQTPFNALFNDTLYTVGTAKLYDKHSKLLYKGKAYLSMDAGPNWVAGQQPGVSFIGLLEEIHHDGWFFVLSSSPGVSSDFRQNCF
jgi:hypothetical protein